MLPFISKTILEKTKQNSGTIDNNPGRTEKVDPMAMNIVDSIHRFDGKSLNRPHALVAQPKKSTEKTRKVPHPLPRRTTYLESLANFKI